MRECEMDLKMAASVEELKKAFRSWAKKLHPDFGGDEEAFKLLNALYSKLLQSLSFGSGADVDVELEMVASSLAHLEGLIIEIVGEWIWVGGATWTHKAAIKEKGFFFSHARKMWYFHNEEGSRRSRSSSMDYDAIKNKYGAKTVRSHASAALGH